MGPASRAGIGAFSSIAAHVVAGLGLAALLTAREIPDQPTPTSRIELATTTLERKEAVPTDAGGTTAPDVLPDDRQALVGTVRRHSATLAEVEVGRAAEVDDGAGRLASTATPAAVPAVSPAVSERSKVAASTPVQGAAAMGPGSLSAPLLAQAERPVPPAMAVSARSGLARSRAPERRIASAAGLAALARPVAAEAPRPLALATAQPEAAQVVAAVAAALPARPTAATGPFFPSVAADAPAAAQPTPEPVAALAGDLAGETVTAIMEFSGDGQTPLDPLGLLAVTAFVAPQSAGTEGRELREGIGDLLSAVPCSRLQTAFDSATGVVELRGHVPDDALRVALTGALQSRIGDALPVVDRLHLLTEPQCGILAQLDALGLPQSEEQFTDPGLIGEDLFVRDYAFSQGERMVIDLEAADYPAFIYVDYFDASGNVLHLIPNEVLPLRLFQAGEAFAIGAAGSGLDLIVEPPFGQDIAIALASDRPLYDGLRPISEPADEYLAFLRQRIAEVAPERAEWVYLLVTTSAER